MTYIGIRPFLALKKIMPTSLFARSLLIIVTPLLLLLISMGYIFYDRHTETIIRQISGTFAGSIAVICNLMDEGALNKSQLDDIGTKLEFSFKTKPYSPFSPDQSFQGEWLFTQVDKVFFQRLGRPYSLRFTEDEVIVDVLTSKAILEVTFLKKRIFSRTTPIVLIWVLITAALVFFIASVFMRNQVRPIRKLADAADKFGRSGQLEKFKPEGAEEVRRAGIAFNRMRERLQRLLNERVEMLAGVSHDLRTPLARMKLQLAMMPPSLDVDLLKDDINQMQKMLQGYLDFAQGTEQEPTTLVNVADLINDVVFRLKSPSFEITINCPLSLRWMLKTVLFKRCLTNLLVNSKRYATRVDITVYTTTANLVVKIDDNGPGIPFNERENVFRPFFRLDTARPLDDGSVGLGLSIARDIVRTHGGQIALEDSEPKGLRVIIRVPK